MIQSTLERPMRKVLALDWEKALYMLIIILALVTRLWALGYRVQSHDESIHAKYAWHLYTGRGFSHHPLMHGPFLFHVTALSYFFFGDNDYAARVPVALMGVLIVAFPYLLRRWLGRKGALVASFFLLISPSILYYSRYVRHDIPAMLWSLVVIFGIFSYLRDGRRRWLFVMAAGVSLLFASKEVSFIYSAINGLFLVGLFAYRTLGREWANERVKPWFPIAMLVLVAGLLFLGISQLSTQLKSSPEEETAIPMLEEQATPAMEDEQDSSPWEIWTGVTKKAGIALIVIGLGAAAIILVAGQLTLSDLPAINPVLSSLVAVMVTCLLIIGIDTTLGIVFAERWPAAPDWLAVWGRIGIWMVLLIGEVVVLVRYLGKTGLEPHQFTSILLVILIVVVGTFIRLGIPSWLSVTSCHPGVQSPAAEAVIPYLTCVRTARDMFSWPEGGTFIPLPLRFTDGILIDARLMLTVLPFLGGITVALMWLVIKVFRHHRAFDLAILLATLCLPFLSPLLMKLSGLKPLDYEPPGFYYTGAIAIETFILSIAIGLMWDLRRLRDSEHRYTWLTAAGIHYAIFVALFTTFLTNAYGIASGTVGSLGYWLDQQEVQRGGQPWYYYILMVGLYEYLPWLLTIVAPIYLAVRGWLVPRLRANPKPLSSLPGISDHFVVFALWWVGTSWIGYSVAGEKMPWLTVHLALPMILVGAWLVGRLLETIQWRQIGQRRTWLLGILVIPLAIAIGVFVDALSKQPFSGYSLAQLQTSGRFVNALLGIVVCGAGVVYVIQRSGWRMAARVLLLVGLLVPVALTVRTAWRFSYIDFDYATEFLVYAHGAPGVRRAVEQIEEISYRYGGGPYAIEVPYGADGSTFFHWQLRHYEPDYSFGESPTGDQLDAPVIIAARGEWDEVDRYAGDSYITREYIYIWWPMQDYWNLSWERIKFAITDPSMRAALWDIWYDRDYTKYDQATGESHTPDSWPLRGDFRLYIRNDVAAQIWDLPVSFPPETATSVVPIDYEGAWQDLTARLTFGTPGSELGQLQNPRGIKVDSDGFVYVADAGNQRIQKFTSDGEPVAVWSQGFREPWDVAVGPDGDTIFVADTWNHQIQHLDMDGTVLNRWGTFGEYTSPGNVGQSAFYGPRGVAVGPAGQVYVADTGNKRIQVFDTEGQFLFVWGGGGSLSGYLEEPVGIAIGPNDEIYVADTWNRRIQVFSFSGTYIREWSIEGWDASDSEEKYHLAAEEKPYLTVDTNGFVYVTDPSNYRVLVFDDQGNYVLSFGKQGVDASSFLLPTGIAVAGDGTIYVTDAHSGRVLVFDALDLSIEGEEEEEVVLPKLKHPIPGSTVDGGTVVLVGTGQPISRVRVLVDRQAVDTVEVDSDGAWILSVEIAEPGEHTISLQGLQWSPEAELEIAVSSESYTLTIAEEEPGVDSDARAPTVDIEAGAEYPAGEVAVSGTGQPGLTLRVLLDDEEAGTTRIGSDGAWLLTVLIEEPGEHQVVAQALDDRDTVTGASEPVMLTITVE